MALSLSISQDTKPTQSSTFLSPYATASSISFSSASSTSTLSDLDQLPSPSISSPKSKTSAFFSSPWSPRFSPQPSLPPPLSPPRRSSSGSSAATTATTASSVLPEHDSPEQRARSLNAAFFSRGKDELLSVPPPSTWSASSREGSPPPADLLLTAERSSPLPKPRLPLARLFPSRFTTNARDQHNFIDIDQTPRIGDPWGTEPLAPLVSSPTTGDASPTTGDASPTSVHPPWADPARRIVSTALPSPPPAPPPALPSPGLARELHHRPDADGLGLKNGAGRPLCADTSLESPSGRAFLLARELGRGAFSHVWLARDVSPADDVDNGTLSRVPSARGDPALRLEGLTPTPSALPTERPSHADDLAPPRGGGRLVAVKLTDRALCEVNDRTRVSFIREVEVLKHISHRSIVSYITSFTTPSHHVLVLEHLGGGELFDLINSDEKHLQLDERLLRRMFGELCKAVGWMHSVGLVHRDIKLENILLTRNPLGAPLPPRTTPVLKLTDFGLARFIDPAEPMLATRCGSESYAAPEIITGRKYDGRQTDAWACGVVLFALATRTLPFDLPSTSDQPADPARARRKLLMRIAGGEYSWPEPEDDLPDDDEEDWVIHGIDGGLNPSSPKTIRRGTALAGSKGVRAVVDRLLVRDPAKRATMSELWEEAWMWGPGAPVAPASASRSGSLSRRGSGFVRRRSRRERRRAATVAAADRNSRQTSLERKDKDALGLVLSRPEEPGRANSLPFEPLPVVVTDDSGLPIEPVTDGDATDEVNAHDGDEEDVEVEEHGVLVDKDTIDDIARQELR